MYPPGTKIAYRDSTETVSDGADGIVEGVVNGEPRDLADAGELTHLPVWTERDNGREPTTIWVGFGNIVGPVEN